MSSDRAACTFDLRTHAPLVPGPLAASELECRLDRLVRRITGTLAAAPHPAFRHSYIPEQHAIDVRTCPPYPSALRRSTSCARRHHDRWVIAAILARL